MEGDGDLLPATVMPAHPHGQGDGEGLGVGQRPRWLQGWSPFEDRFCAEYLAHGCNGPKAVLAAGYVSPKGAKDPTGAARQLAIKLLKREHIQKRIQQLHNQALAAAEVTTNRLLQETKRIAYADLRELYYSPRDPKVIEGAALAGDLKPAGELGDDIAAAVAGIDVQKDFLEGVEVGQTKKVKLANKIAALELLMKHRNMLGDNRGKQTVLMVNIKL